MAILDRFRSNNNGSATTGAPPNPFTAAPATQDGTAGAFATTARAVDPAEAMPRVGGVPLGASGRGNLYGIPRWDELNPKLIGPRGMLTYDEMYRTDPHIRRLILAAWSPVVAGTWLLEPFGGDDASDQDRQVADKIWWMLTDWMRPSLLEHLLELGPLLLRSGFAPFEQIWDTCQYKGSGPTLIGPRKLDVRLPRTVWQWWQDEYGDLTHIGQITPEKPSVPIPATELCYYRVGAEGDNWMGQSLIRHAFKSWRYKDILERIDSIGQERKAVGMPVLYRSPDIPDAILADVEKALATMHMSEAAYMMLPGWKMGMAPQEAGAGNQWLVDVIKFDSSSGEGIQKSLTYHQQAISASFLTDFLELGHHQVGARATAQVQQDPFLTAINGALLPLVVPVLDRLVDRICKLNFSGVEGSPSMKLTLTDEASLSEIANYIQVLVGSEVIQVDPDLEDWVRERANLPVASAEVREQNEQARQAAIDAAAQAAKNPDQNAAQNQPASGQTPAQAAQQSEKLPGGGKQLAQPTPKWFERLLSQDELRQAFDGARDHIETTVGPMVKNIALGLANQARNNTMVQAPPNPPPQLVDALTQHYEQLYHLGSQTVALELMKQRAHLGRRLDAPEDAAAGAVAGRRFARARKRGEHSARNIIGRIHQQLGRQQITGLQKGTLLQDLATREAKGALRAEAVANAAPSINDGRNDTAQSSPGVAGAYYTSVLDERTCAECETADDGSLLTPDEAASYGPPNPLCAGSTACRCCLVWVLDSDPSVMAGITG